MRLLLVGALAVCWLGAQEPVPNQKELHKLLYDWAGLTRYGSENTEVHPPKPGENRVVFFGGDFTEGFPQQYFAGKPWFNRGIERQTSAQMLVRFRQDVIALQPKVVVIEAGSNDLGGYTGPMTEGVIGDNYTSMVELAKANGIKVVLASVLPVSDAYTNQTARRPQGKIIGLNGWIHDFADKAGAVYLDYYKALADGRNFKKDLTSDGLHPNDAGYAVMAPLAEQAVARALKQ